MATDRADSSKQTGCCSSAEGVRRGASWRCTVMTDKGVNEYVGEGERWMYRYLYNDGVER